MKTCSADERLVSVGQKRMLFALLSIMISGCGLRRVDHIVPIVDVARLRSGGVQHAGNLLIRMSQSEWEEANVKVVEGSLPKTGGPSMFIFEIPTFPGGEIVRFLKPNCPPCFNIVFTYYGWQCRADIRRCPPPPLDPCREVRIPTTYRIACFGSCPEGENCEYRAIRFSPEFARLVMQTHAAELTAISIAMKDSGFKAGETFSRVRVIGYYCGCR